MDIFLELLLTFLGEIASGLVQGMATSRRGRWVLFGVGLLASAMVFFVAWGWFTS